MSKIWTSVERHDHSADILFIITEVDDIVSNGDFCCNNSHFAFSLNEIATCLLRKVNAYTIISFSEFLCRIVQDEDFIRKLSGFFSDTTEDFEIILYMIYLITSRCEDPIAMEVFESFTRNGVTGLLLEKVGLLPDRYQFILMATALSLIIKKSHPEISSEEFFMVRGNIFSAIPRFIHVGKSLELNDEGSEADEIASLSATTMNFTAYIASTDLEYCRSMIRSQLEDGTVLKIVELFVKIGESDPSFLELQICEMSHAIYKVYCADLNDEFDTPNRGIDRELRIVIPTLLDHLWTCCDNATCRFCTCTVLQYMINTRDKDNVDFFSGINFFRTITQMLIGEIHSKDICYDRASLLWSLVGLTFDRLRETISVDNAMLLLPHFSKLIGLNTYDSKLLQYPTRAESVFFSTTMKFCSDCMEYVQLREEHWIQLVDLDFIPMLIDVLTQTYRNTNDGDVVLHTVENILFSLKSFLSKVPHRDCPKVIAQLMPASSMFREFLTSEKYHDKNYDISCEKIVRGTCQLLTDISLQFLKCQTEHTRGVNNQVTEFIGTELQMVDSIGKAITLSDDTDALSKLFGLLTNLGELVADKKAMIKKMVAFLPHICEKGQACDSLVFDQTTGKYTCSHITQLAEAAVAYSIDDVKPTVVSSVVAPEAFVTLKFKEVSPVRFNFDKIESEDHVHTDHFNFQNSTPIKLRVIWNLSQKYPEMTHDYFVSSHVFKDCTCTSKYHISDEIAKAVINTAIFYLDQAEEHSIQFLQDLTEFVGDLSCELDNCKRIKEVFIDLLGACNRFINHNSQKKLVANVTEFVDIMHYNWLSFTSI